MTELIFVRHGESESNERGLFTGQTDVSLSGLGEKQATALKNFILKEYAVDAVYSSDLKRARDTVLPIAKALHLPVQTNARLREIYGGLWEERPIRYIAENYEKDYMVWCENIGLARCTGGESMEEVQKRGIAAVGEIAEANVGKTVLIGTHAGFLRAMQCYWQGLPLERMKDIPWVPNASVTVVRYNGGAPALISLADVSFLQGVITELTKGI